MSDEELKGKLARLRVENAALKKGASSGIRLKVSEKGAASVQRTMAKAVGHVGQYSGVHDANEPQLKGAQIASPGHPQRVRVHPHPRSMSVKRHFWGKLFQH